MIFKIYQLHLNFSLDNQCSSSLNTSHSLEWIHQSHSLKSNIKTYKVTKNFQEISENFLNSQHYLHPSRKLINLRLFFQRLCLRWYLFFVAQNLYTFKVKDGFQEVCLVLLDCFKMENVTPTRNVKFLELYPCLPSYTYMFMLEAMTYKVHTCIWMNYGIVITIFPFPRPPPLRKWYSGPSSLSTHSTLTQAFLTFKTLFNTSLPGWLLSYS